MCGILLLAGIDAQLFVGTKQLGASYGLQPTPNGMIV